MTDLADVVQFSSLKQFNTAYLPVSDEVYLFHPLSACIEASNYSAESPAVDSKIGKSFYEEFNVGSAVPREGVTYEFEKEQNGLRSFWKLSVSSVCVAGEPYKMAVVSKNPAHRANIAADEAEKVALLNEVYHRVKNNLNIIVSLLSLQIKRIPDPVSRHMLIESKSRVYTLSLLQQKLYNSPRISQIKAGNYLHCLALSVLSAFKAPDKDIKLKTEVEEPWLNMDTLVPLGLIAHELITNAVLHAFKEQEKGEIEVRFLRLSSGRFLLSVKDNGSGLDNGKIPEDAGSLGFQLVKSLVKQLRADFSIDSRENVGSSFTIEFEEARK